MNKLVLAYFVGLSIIGLAFFMPRYFIKSKPEPKKLYFEFRKKDSSVTADGFLRYKGKWCPIVLKDSMAVIYQ